MSTWLLIFIFLFDNDDTRSSKRHVALHSFIFLLKCFSKTFFIRCNSVFFKIILIWIRFKQNVNGNTAQHASCSHRFTWECDGSSWPKLYHHTVWPCHVRYLQIPCRWKHKQVRKLVAGLTAYLLKERWYFCVHFHFRKQRSPQAQDNFT